MYIHIDPSTGVPPYLQVKQQIKTYIALGRLNPDDALPTVRALAGKLVLNPNTIARAYRELESEGLLTSRVGAGTYVTHQKPGLTLRTKQVRVRELLLRGVVEGFTVKLSAGEIRSIFESILQEREDTDLTSTDEGPGQVSDARS